jgi:cytochrome c553
MPGVPSLAGQPDGFLQWQMVYFRSKNRKSDVMEPLAASLKDGQIRALGAYFAALAPPRPDQVPDPDPDPALSARGRQLTGTRRCTSCHGDAFDGAKAAARIAGQREDYLYKALTDYRDGRRVGGGVAAMPDAVFGMTSDDLTALAHFLSRFPNP